MRYLYSLLLYLLTPLIILYLKYRARKNPQYAKHWSERFGYNLVNQTSKPVIWLHAVSVGETRAMAKLISLLSSSYPEYQIITTHMTPTGREMAKTLYPQAHSYYVPYDMPHAVINFYKTFRPKLGLIMETEIWPNLIFYAYEYHIPLCLINARLSLKSYTAYAKLRYLVTPVLNQLTMIMAQDKLTADNFAKLGFNRQLEVIGSTKFDLLIDDKQLLLAQLLKQQILHKKIVVFASTRDGEEQMILATLPRDISYVVVIVPRHPERFNLVEGLIKQTGRMYQKRSAHLPIASTTEILLGDSLGEMMAYYQLADIAVIGGSFADFGSHNPIEPLYLHKPVILGPSTYNFTQISQDALMAHCALQVNNMAECHTQIAQLLTDPSMYATLSANCTNFITRYQGASEKIMQLITRFL